MPRKNDRVRVRHIPKAAQPQKGERRTSRGEFILNEYGPPLHMPSKAKRQKLESGLAIEDLPSRL